MDKSAPASVPIDDLLRRRWSPRAFAERLIEPEKLRSLLESARWAASSSNEQPWRFLLATRDDRPAFERLASSLVQGNRWAEQAAALVVTVARMTFTRGGTPNPHAWHDIGLAMGNFTVQATMLGLHLHQMAGFDPELIRSKCEVPEGYEPVTAVAVGYLGDPESLPEPLRTRELAPRTRKELHELVFRDRFGNSHPAVV